MDPTAASFGPLLARRDTGFGCGRRLSAPHAGFRGQSAAFLELAAAALLGDEAIRSAYLGI